MRVELQPRVPPARQGFDGKRDVATAGLAGNAMTFGRQIIVVDVVDLALVVTGQDRPDRGRAIAAITDHGFHRLIVGMAAEERHDVEVFAPKPQQEGLYQAGRQNDAHPPGAQFLRPARLHAIVLSPHGYLLYSTDGYSVKTGNDEASGSGCEAAAGGLRARVGDPAGRLRRLHLK